MADIPRRGPLCECEPTPEQLADVREVVLDRAKHYPDGSELIEMIFGEGVSGGIPA